MEPPAYPDLRAHLAALEAAGLLFRVDEPICKDTELHPLVRWQFRGGLAESRRRAFLFTAVTGAGGRRYDMPVVVGALAANAEIYRIGMGVPLDRIGDRWGEAIAAPVPPVEVADPPCQEMVVEGAALSAEGGGLDALPVPISTPGFDCAPYLTATGCVTVDPATGVQNMGTYRAGLKAPDRLAVRMATRANGAEGYRHWLAWQARGEDMPCAIVLGPPPAVAYCAPQKLRMGLDEVAVAGGIVGAPIRVARCRTVPLTVPAESEIVVEGMIDTTHLEPEAPFGESHGHVAVEEYNMILRVGAITHRRDAVLPSIVSQVTPSESSVIKRVAYEPLFLAHLRDHLGIRDVRRVVMHEPLTNIRRVIFLQFARGAPRTEVWRALYGAASLQSACGKYVVAVSDDVDPENVDAVWWSMAYRANPAEDSAVLGHRHRGHGPKPEDPGFEDSTMLVDATLKGDLPPVALPKKAYMERAREIWDRLGLPPLAPQAPWHGYSLGDWTESWEEAAARAAAGDYLANGRLTAQRRRAGVAPETPVRQAGEGDDG